MALWSVKAALGRIAVVGAAITRARCGAGFLNRSTQICASVTLNEFSIGRYNPLALLRLQAIALASESSNAQLALAVAVAVADAHPNRKDRRGRRGAHWRRRAFLEARHVHVRRSADIANAADHPSIDRQRLRCVAVHVHLDVEEEGRLHLQINRRPGEHRVGDLRAPKPATSGEVLQASRQGNLKRRRRGGKER